MKGESSVAATWVPIGRARFNRDGKDGLIDLYLEALRNRDTGETRIEIQIPNAERLSLGDDLGVLLQCFGWGMVALGFEAALLPPNACHDCCQVVQKVEYLLRLD